MQSCKPTLYTCLAQANLQRLLCSISPPQRTLSAAELDSVVVQDNGILRQGSFTGYTAQSPFEDELWLAVKERLLQAILTARPNGCINTNGSLIYVQVDNRQVGKGSNWDEHQTFRILHNFNSAVGAQLGFFIRFQTDRAPFTKYSPFWVATLIFLWLSAYSKKQMLSTWIPICASSQQISRRYYRNDLNAIQYIQLRMSTPLSMLASFMYSEVPMFPTALYNQDSTTLAGTTGGYSAILKYSSFFHKKFQPCRRHFPPSTRARFGQLKHGVPQQRSC